MEVKPEIVTVAQTTAADSFWRIMKFDAELAMFFLVWTAK